jgi:hypothetical protein
MSKSKGTDICIVFAGMIIGSIIMTSIAKALVIHFFEGEYSPEYDSEEDSLYITLPWFIFWKLIYKIDVIAPISLALLLMVIKYNENK